MADYRSLLYPGEEEFFRQHRDVAGMVSPWPPTEDSEPVISPYFPSTPQTRDSVAENEAMRLLMYRMGISPAAEPTAQQRLQFQGTPYASDEGALRATIAARQMSGDPSGLSPTPDQRSFNAWFKRQH